MVELIINLTDIKPRHLVVCGSKATNLGAVARKSRTAAGFCLTTAAYFQTLNQSEIYQDMKKLVAFASGKNFDELEQVSATIQTLIRGVTLPDQVEEALWQSYQGLVKGREGIKVAVRSSATIEDLPSASFAGQLESYLNQESWCQVKKAVVDCWASLWAPRAMHYRLQKELDQGKAGMAVIVQEMVPAQVSGVMFTANPLTHSRREIYIEAVAGLADSLVQGQVSGEVYTVDKETLSITSRVIKGNYPLLVDFALRQLAHEGKKLEYLFEDYQDVEWAFWNEELFILQTRPITTLGEEEVVLPASGEITPIQGEIITNIQERFPEPVLPLDTVIAKIYYLSLFTAYRELGFSVPVVDWHQVEQGIFPDYFIPPAIKVSPRRVFYLGKMLIGDLMEEWKYNEATFDRYVQLMEQDVVKNFPMEIIMEYLEDGLKDFQRANTFRYLLYIQYGSIYNLLNRLLNYFYGQEGQEIFEDIVAGHPQMTMEMNRDLKELAGLVSEDEELRQFVLTHNPEEILVYLNQMVLARDIKSSFDLFLQQHGPREVSQGLGGIGAATWKDKPEIVWGMIKGLIFQDEAMPTRELALEARQKEAERRLSQLASQGWGRVLPLRRIFDILVGYSRRYIAFRENSHFYLTQAMLVFRTLFLAIGNQLASRGYLGQETDIMFLTFWEVRDLVYDIYSLKKVSSREIEEKLTERQKQYEQRRNNWVPRGVTEIQLPGEVLMGVGASRGQVRGPCRIINDPAELHRLRPGDILVAQATNPSWTPVFSFIGGLVVEYGSVLSHAAIIAREYGIPAVMGVPGVTRLLSDGHEIMIDGGKGLVVTE